MPEKPLGRTLEEVSQGIFDELLWDLQVTDMYERRHTMPRLLYLRPGLFCGLPLHIYD